MRSIAVAAALVITFAGIAFGEDKPNHVNRLAKENSPYLQQHAHNPVDWYPWGDEAFAKAKKENKLIFLSIGYSSCHWCHVMERESFNNPEVAKLLNDSFVCIKVDREERPDIDQIYMTALHALGNNGGWPLSMFLMPDGRPIVGGTYWPPEDREIEGKKVLGFKSLLGVTTKFQKERPQDLEEQAKNLADATRQSLDQAAPGKALVQLDRKLVFNAVTDVLEEFDEVHGGFGNPRKAFRGTKFPMPSYLELLLIEGKRENNNDILAKVDLTLEKMARGGIYDQLGGGFHRYSTERTWTVPHFEKMLYDNAQLVEVYSRAFAVQPKPIYRRVVEETLDFVIRNLTSPEGAFYSSLDADSEGEEGRFYVWMPKDLESAGLTKEELQLARTVYGIDQGTNFEDKYSILVLKKPLEDAESRAKLSVARQKLLAVRSKRPKPFLDTKVLTAWNGQMIAGFAVAGEVFKEPKYTTVAAKTADFILKTMKTKDGRLLRSYMPKKDDSGGARLNGYLDDYAFLAHGLLALHQATGDRRWLVEAHDLTDTMLKLFADEKNGGFFYTAHDHEKLFARAKDQFDGAQPCGNSVAARNLMELAKRTGEKKYREQAEKTLQTFAANLKSSPTSLTEMVIALSEFIDLPQGKPPVESKKPTPTDDKATKSESVVKVTAAADKADVSGKQVVTITLEIEKDWHTYANPVENDMLEPVQTEVKIAGKNKPKTIEVKYPKGKKVIDPAAGDYSSYEGKIEIKATVERPNDDREPLEVSVKFIACSEKLKQCLLPANLKLTVP
jgi:uncharacterized protein YyaL (SSP411 family)